MVSSKGSISGSISAFVAPSRVLWWLVRPALSSSLRMWATSRKGLGRWNSAVVLGITCGLGLGLGLTSCSNNRPVAEPGEEQSAARAQPGAGDSPEVVVEEEPARPVLPRVAKASLVEHPASVVWVFDGDPSAPKKMEISEAEAAGFTVVDLSNGWVPYIFSDKTVGVDDEAANEYREMYVGLANNRNDADGKPLKEHEGNYLELYGIPPTLEVIHGEWERAEEVQTCLDEAGFDPEVFSRFSGVIA